jgi:hypothetical protein
MAPVNWFRSRSLISTEGLIYDRLRRPAGPDGQGSLAVITLGGIRGSGKTEFLKELRSRCRDLPHAWVDFEARPGMTRRDLFNSLRIQLGMKRRQFGRIPFPRLILGLLVRDREFGVRDDQAVHRPDPDDVRHEIEHLVRNHPLVRGFATNDGRSPDPVRVEMNLLLFKIDITAFLGLLQRLACWTVSGLRMRKHFAAALEWYAQLDRGDSYEALRWLNEAGPADADRILCEAFLADLVAAYTRDPDAPRRTLNCMILLDNAHRDEGREFLDLLAATPRQLQAGDPVPLVVVATTRRPDRWFVPEESVQARGRLTAGQVGR